MKPPKAVLTWLFQSGARHSCGDESVSSAVHVIVVDDCGIVRDSVSAQVESDGYDVSSAEGGQALRSILGERNADLVILDQQLPDENGLSLLKMLRASSDCGVIMLSSQGSPLRRSIALEHGADDFIVKPHDGRELLARVRAVLRRREAVQAASLRSSPAHGLRVFGRWAFDPAARLARAGEREMPLTGAEFALLNELTQVPGQTVTREHLLRAVYGRVWTYEDRSIDVLVTRTRRKLDELVPGERPIESVRGVGYVLRQNTGVSDAAPAALATIRLKTRASR